jgi:hypothetical protein
MGALVEGFAAARQKHEAQLAENHARDQFIEDQLRGLGRLLDADATFLSEHGMTHTIRSRTMHVEQRRAPLITVHFDPAEKNFLLTFMKDGTHLISATTDEAAKAIGAHVYDLQRQK